MIVNISDVLKKLDINRRGRYDNKFYVIDLDDSDDYARTYTKLERNAVNTEYPTIEKNTNDTTMKIINYFETEVGVEKYLIFLYADFENDKYYMKIGEAE